MSERSQAPRSGGRTAGEHIGQGRDADTRRSDARGARHFATGDDTRRSGIGRGGAGQPATRGDRGETEQPRVRVRDTEGVRAKRTPDEPRGTRRPTEPESTADHRRTAQSSGIGRRPLSTDRPTSSRGRATGEIPARDRDPDRSRDRLTGEVAARTRRTGEVAAPARRKGEVSGRTRATGELSARDRRSASDLSSRDRLTGSVSGRDRLTGSVSGRDRLTGSVSGRDRNAGELSARDRRSGSDRSRDRATGDMSGRARLTGSGSGRDRKTGGIAAGRLTGAGSGRDRVSGLLAGRDRVGPSGRARRSVTDAPVDGTAALDIAVTATEPLRQTGDVSSVGPRLRVAPPAPISAPRAPFVASMIGLVVVGVLGILLINTKTNENSFKIDDLKQQDAALDNQQQDLQNQLVQVSSIGNLDAAARRLGLVKAENPALIRLPDGKFIGVLTPTNGRPAVTAQDPKTAGDATGKDAGADQAGLNGVTAPDGAPIDGSLNLGTNTGTAQVGTGTQADTAQAGTDAQAGTAQAGTGTMQGVNPPGSGIQGNGTQGNGTQGGNVTQGGTAPVGIGQ